MRDGYDYVTCCVFFHCDLLCCKISLLPYRFVVKQSSCVTTTGYDSIIAVCNVNFTTLCPLSTLVYPMYLFSFFATIESLSSERIRKEREKKKELEGKRQETDNPILVL